MRTVVEHLAERARTHAAQVALQIPIGSVNRTGPTPHRAVTFAELDADSDALAAGMRRVGIAAGTRVAVMVPPGLDFFALTFALFKIGAVPVLIDPGMGIKNLGKCLAQAEPGAFVGVPKAHLARRLFRWANRSVRVTVNVGGWRFGCTASTRAMRRDLTPPPPLRSGEGESDALAAILFTSGSTGLAKGVEYTHAIFAAQIELLRRTYGIEPGEIDFCTFPLFALFGAALGMTCVVPDMDATRPATIDPAKVRSQLRQFRCTNLFGSPAVLKRLANEPAADVSAYASLRRVLSAGAPATPAVLEAFTKLLPAGAAIFTPYGATECLPVANISSVEILGETRALTEQGRGVCVGRPVDGVEVLVIPIADGAMAEMDFKLRRGTPRGCPAPDAVATSEPVVAPPRINTLEHPVRGTHEGCPYGSIPVVVGEFVVRGPVVTPRYFRNPDATALAKIRDPATGETLHRMGDVGYIDDRGRLWFCGRKSHRVITPWGTLFTDMAEPVFNTVPGVVRTALVGVMRDDVTFPVICIEFYGPQHCMEDGFIPRFPGRSKGEVQRLFTDKAKHYPHTAKITTFLDYPGFFPVDVRHNSKIFREKLAVWADRQLGPNWKGGPA